MCDGFLVGVNKYIIHLGSIFILTCQNLFPDLAAIFQHSKEAWLGYEELDQIFLVREELPLTTEPIIYPFQVGLHLRTEAVILDHVVWDEMYVKYIFADLLFQYSLSRLHRSDGFTYERRVYRCEEYGNFKLCHYRLHRPPPRDVDTDDTEPEPSSSDETDTEEDDVLDGEAGEDDFGGLNVPIPPPDGPHDAAQEGTMVRTPPIIFLFLCFVCSVFFLY